MVEARRAAASDKSLIFLSGSISAIGVATR